MTANHEKLRHLYHTTLSLCNHWKHTVTFLHRTALHTYKVIGGYYGLSSWPPWPKLRITIQPENGMPMRVRPRGKASLGKAL